MKRFIIQICKYTWAPLIVSIIIFYLCCLISPRDIPEVGFEFFIPTDKIVHFLMFFGLSLVACFNYIYIKKGQIIVLKMITFAILVPIIYGGAIEILQQQYFEGRSGDWFDFLADSLGALSALPIALFFRRKLLNKEEQ